jgi:cytoskeletal protein CcmA (bactofilin family)
MKKFLLYFTLFVFVIPSIALAAVFQTDKNISSSDVIDGNAYFAGGNITIEGAVKGDLLVSGGKIDIIGSNAIINGDLIVAGGNITIDGTINDDVLIAGGNITFSGSTGGDLRIFGGNISINGEVRGEVIVMGGQVRYGKDTIVHGDILSKSGAGYVDPGAQFLGETSIQYESDAMSGDYSGLDLKKEKIQPFLTIAYWVSQAFWLFGLLIIAGVLFGLFPKYTNKGVALALKQNEAWKSIGLGLALLIVTPVLAVISFATVVGIYLGFILLLSYVLLIMFSVVMAGILFGGIIQRMVRKTKKVEIKWGYLILGIILLHILTMIPVIGWVIALVFIVFTIGTVTRVEWAIYK